VAASEHVFHVGDRALYRFGDQDVEVEVVEERGPIGVHGSRVVRVRLPLMAAEPVEFSVAEARLRQTASAA
jgi:hypothetical protein